MKRLLFSAAILLTFCSCTRAQSQAPTDMQTIIDAVIDQRNVCSNNLALAMAQIKTSGKQMDSLKAELEKANAQIKELTPAAPNAEEPKGKIAPAEEPKPE
jgi:hypothetical protein